MKKNYDLMIPRWRVIAGFPRSKYKVGKIYYGLTFPGDTITYISPNKYQRGTFDIPGEFPHLFQELNWWEERDISEMPKFIKFQRKRTFSVYEVCSPHEGFPAFGRNYVNFFDDEGNITMEEMKYLRNFSPATEEEFLEFQKLK